MTKPRSGNVIVSAAAAAGLFISTHAGAQDGLPYQIPAPPDSVSFGVGMASGGDIDGDGRDDLLIIDWDWTNNQGEEIGRFSCHAGADGSLLWSDVGLSPHASRLGTVFVEGAGVDGPDGVAVVIGNFESRQESDPGELRLYDSASGEIRWSVPGIPDEFEFSYFLAAVGDLTNDDVDEIAVVETISETATIRIFNGDDGSIVNEITSVPFPARLAPAGDVDGDRKPDLVVQSAREYGTLDPNEVLVVSAQTGEIIHTLSNPDGDRSHFGWHIAGGADATGDDVPDVLVCRPDRRDGRAFLFSGADGSLHERFTPPPGANAPFAASCALADVTGDQRAELLISDSARTYLYRPDSIEPVRFWWSGVATENTLFGAEHAVGDLNSDGYADVIGNAVFINEPAVNAYGGAAIMLGLDPLAGDPSVEIEPGDERHFIVAGADPNAAVRVFASRTGNDCTFVPRLGICINLSQPIHFIGKFEADTSGTASFVLNAPRRASPGLAWMQALEFNHRGVGPATSDVTLLNIED